MATGTTRILATRRFSPRLQAGALLALLLCALLALAPPPAAAAQAAPPAYAPPAGLKESAERLLGSVRDGVAAPAQVKSEALEAQRDQAKEAQNWPRAIAFQRQLVQRALAANDRAADAAPALTALAELFLNAQDNLASAAAAYAAVDRAGTAPQRAAALQVLSDALAAQREWQDAAAALVAAQAAAADPKLQEDRLAWLRAQYLMDVQRVEVLADQSIPEACIEFSRPLAQPLPLPAGDYIRLTPETRVSVSAGESALCIAGLEHGASYEAVVRKGLPQADGPALAADAEVAISVGQRPPSVGFPTGPYVLPTARAPAVDLRTVNVGEVALRLIRIDDRNLVGQLRDGLSNPLYGGQVDTLTEESGELVWQGTMPVEEKVNEEQRTAVPVGEMLRAPEPGIYVLLATNAEDPEQVALAWTDWASQWIVLSDIGLTSYRGEDGMHVMARSLGSGAPLGGIELRLVSRNNQVLDSLRTDAQGYARFAPGLLQGSGGNRPAALFALAEARGPADFTFLELTGPGLELSERGVAGRPAPGPVDAYVYADRGVFRPGEEMPVNLLLRDGEGRALPRMPVVLSLKRPDGREAARQPAVTGELGWSRSAFQLAQAAQTGAWTVDAYADPDGQPVGSLTVAVEDFVPQRIALELRTAADALRPGRAVEIAAQGDYLYGAPAAGLPVKAVLTLQQDPRPYPDLPGFHFGLVEDPYSPQRRPLPDTRTGAQGQADLSVLVADLPDTPQPLQAKIDVSLFDEGGRPVTRSVTLPVRTGAPAIGLKPGFAEGQVAEGQAAVFEVALVDGHGAAVAGRSLDVTWIEEDVDYFWYWEDGNLRYRETVRDRPVEQGDVTTDAQGRAQISQRLGWGRYRVAVADRSAGAASSFRFQVGWGVAPSLPDTPDALELVLDPDPSGAARELNAFVKAPFAGVLELLVVNDALRYRRTLPLPESGTHVSIPVQPDWGVGAYVLATAYRPEAGAGASRGPGRAMGAAWFPIGTGARTLDVALDPPEVVRPGRRVEVPVIVKAADPAVLAGGVKLAVAAVDEGILQLTGFDSPDPVAHYFGQRRLAMDIHDLYGRLIAPATGARGEPRSGGDAGGNLAGLSVQTTRVVALFDGPVVPDAEGRATVAFDLPEGFNGRLRLMATAWGRTAIGAASAPLTVRDPLVSSLILPQFLAPGDEAEAVLSLDNVDGAAGVYAAEVTAEGAVAVLDGGSLEQRIDRGGRVRQRVTLSGVETGTGRLALRLTGPDGLQIAQGWEIAVRPAQPWQSRRELRQLAGGETLTSATAAAAGMTAATAQVELTVSPVPDFNAPALLASLRDYRYRCLEQAVSVAYPEIFAPSLAARWQGLEADPVAAAAAVQEGIRSTVARQKPDGSFGMWSMGGPSEPWLTIYAMDFLGRARAEGHAVPGPVLDQGRNWMTAALHYPPEGLTPDGQAYALYVLARMAALDAGTLRYWADSLAERVTTPLALAFLGSVRRAAGEPLQGTAQLVLTAAESGGEARPAVDWRDFGSGLRDAAATLAVLAEAGVAAPQLAPLLAAVTGQAAARSALSTQEEAWLLRAAQAVAGSDAPAPMRLQVAGELLPPMHDAWTARRSGAAEAVAIRNAGAAPVWAYQTLRGVPAASLPPASEGMTISRRYFRLDGTEIAPDKASQNDQFVVLLEGGASDGGKHQALVVDLLPAGFEIESRATGGATALSSLPFLPLLSEPLFTGIRSDRFIGALDLDEDRQNFALAYLVRAVTPGRFVHPAPYVEDMYRPYLFARGALGEVTVARP